MQRAETMGHGTPRSRSPTPERPDSDGPNMIATYAKMTQFRITLQSGEAVDLLVTSRPLLMDWSLGFPRIRHACGRLLRINPSVLTLDRSRDDEVFAGLDLPVVFGMAPVEDVSDGDAKDARILGRELNGWGDGYVVVQAAIEKRIHVSLTFVPPYCERCERTPAFTVPVKKVLEWTIPERPEVNERLENATFAGVMYMFDMTGVRLPLEDWLKRQPGTDTVQVFIAMSGLHARPDCENPPVNWLCPRCNDHDSYPTWRPRYYQFFIVGAAMAGIFRYLKELVAAHEERVALEATSVLPGRLTPIPETPRAGENRVGSIMFYPRVSQEWSGREGSWTHWIDDIET